jgi:HEAT repeat protein
VPPSREQLVALTTDPTAYLDHADPVLRRLAITALSSDQAEANMPTLIAQTTCDDVAIRAAAAEKLGLCGHGALGTLTTLTTDVEPTVREAVATAFGEIRSPTAVDWLIEAASSDDDRHVREAAVASLGAIGDARAIETLIDVISNGPPQVRRRAIAAITVFDDERVEPAIRRAALDRNPGVREAAEMVVGKQITDNRSQMSDG